MASKIRIKTISGITKPTMCKILEFAFRDSFHGCNIDPKTTSFVALISQTVTEEKENDFVDYWRNVQVPVSFLRVVDKARNEP